MKRRSITLAAALAAVAITGAVFAGGVGARTSRMLAFDVMTGVPSAYTGATNPIRGINGGGLPWIIGSGRGSLTTGGDLKVELTGLVLAGTGSNPIASFRAIVSCQNGDGGVTNVTTAAFPATTGLASAGGGNADIEAQVTLPSPCIAPIVFVTSPGGSWFASTGF
jgi:hypothetical protein